MASTGAVAGRLTGGDLGVLITVQYLYDLRWIYMHVRPESTVREFRLVVNMVFGVPVDQQTLVHLGQVLQDNRTMGSYGLQNGHVIYLARRFVSPASPASTSVASVSASVAPASASVAPASRVPGNNTSDILSGVGSVQSQGSGGGNSSSLISGSDGSSGGTVPGLLINVRCSTESRFDIRARPELTVGEFKGLITQLQNIPVNEQRLIYSGHFLQDERTIGSYGVQEGHVIHLARRFIPATSSVSASVSAAAPLVGGNSMPNISTGVTSVQTQGFGGGASVFFGHGLRGLQQMLGNPEMMNIPATQDLLNDPEIIRNIVINNLRHPELLFFLNNPNMFHERMEITRNYLLSRAIIRDRIMNYIAHRQMHENRQESLLNAIGRIRLDENFLAPHTYANSGPSVPNANPLPNPWGTITGNRAAANGPGYAGASGPSSQLPSCESLQITGREAGVEDNETEDAESDNSV